VTETLMSEVLETPKQRTACDRLPYTERDDFARGQCWAVRLIIAVTALCIMNNVTLRRARLVKQREGYQIIMFGDRGIRAK